MTHKIRFLLLVSFPFICLGCDNSSVSDDVSSTLETISSAVQTNAASHERVTFEAVGGNVSKLDVERILKNQNMQAEIDEFSQVLSMDVEPVVVHDEGMVAQRVTIVDSHGKTHLDVLVKDWVERKSEHSFLQGERDPYPCYQFNQKINSYRFDNKEHLISKISSMTTKKDASRMTTVLSKKQKNLFQRLKQFAEDGRVELKAGKGRPTDVVVKFVTELGSTLDVLKVKIQELCRDALLVGFDIKKDFKYLRIDYESFECKGIVDVQDLYVRPDRPFDKPSLVDLAEQELQWHIQNTDKHLKDMDTQNEVSIKGQCLLGHSSLEDATATILLFLKKVREPTNVSQSFKRFEFDGPRMDWLKREICRFCSMIANKLGDPQALVLDLDLENLKGRPWKNDLYGIEGNISTTINTLKRDEMFGYSTMKITNGVKFSEGVMWLVTTHFTLFIDKESSEVKKQLERHYPERNKNQVILETANPCPPRPRHKFWTLTRRLVMPMWMEHGNVDEGPKEPEYLMLPCLVHALEVHHSTKYRWTWIVPRFADLERMWQEHEKMKPEEYKRLDAQAEVERTNELLMSEACLDAQAEVERTNELLMSEAFGK